MKILKNKKIVNPGHKVDMFSIIISSGLFTGYFPFASGTVGSLFGLSFFLIHEFSNPVILSSSLIILFFTAIFTSNNMVKRYGDDPSVVVADEIIGMWITVLIVNIWLSQSIAISPLSLIVSFLSFRAFDILKIYPANYFDKLKSGFGIMMDDVVAGIYAGIFTSVTLLLIEKWF